jgi:hypothetical protein
MYIVFFTCIFFFVYEFGVLFLPILAFLHIPGGFLSMPTLGIAALCSIGFYFQTENKNQLFRGLLYAAIAWVPWLIYLAFRCDFNDPYSSKKLSLMVFAQFGSILMICCAFYKDQERFTRYFYVCTIGMITILLIYFFLNHAVDPIHSTQKAVRLTTENINPIMLSRTFAIGALSFLLWGRPTYWVKVSLCIPFFVGMYLTGSRGPVISLLILFVVHYLWTQSQYKLFALRLFLSCLLLILTLFTVGASFYESIDKYFSRGHRQGMYQGSGRYDAAIVTWKEFVSAPVFGVGLGRYGKPGKQTTLISGKSNIDRYRSYPHNILYEVLAELGIFGAILFILLLRPGAWIFDFSNKFIFLFLLCFLFAMTSGDFFDNAGMFIFGYIARLNRKPQIEVAV